VRLPEILRLVWRPGQWWAHGVRTLLMAYFLCFGIAFALRTPFSWEVVHSSLLLALPLAGVLQWTLHRALQDRAFPLAWASPAALCCTALVNAWYFAGWYVHREYQLQHLAEQLEPVLPAGAVVAGNSAPSACLELPVATMLVIPRLANYPHPVERYGVTHLMVLDGIQGEWWWRMDYPDLLRRRYQLMRAWVGPYGIAVYRVPSWARENYRMRWHSQQPSPVQHNVHEQRRVKGGS